MAVSTRKADKNFRYVAEDAWLFYPNRFFGKGYLLSDAKRDEIGRFLNVVPFLYWIGYGLILIVGFSFFGNPYEHPGLLVFSMGTLAVGLLFLRQTILARKLRGLSEYDKGLSLLGGYARISRGYPIWMLLFIWLVTLLFPFLGVLIMYGAIKNLMATEMLLFGLVIALFGGGLASQYGYMLYYRVRHWGN